MNKIVILCVDDWQIMYINGQPKSENHEIQIRDLNKFCPIQSIVVNWVDGTPLGEYIEYEGWFPTGSIFDALEEVDMTLEDLDLDEDDIR